MKTTSSTTYPGIDYSLGRSNVHAVTGIHFGVISQNSINMDCTPDFEYDYGKPQCPKCGNEVLASDDPTLFDGIEIDDIVRRGGIQSAPDGTPDSFDHQDYTCVDCNTCYWSDEVYGDEPNGWTYQADGYQLADCLDNDVFVLESPYYTLAQYCSPCVPGAGNLDNPCDNGPKTYALGHDWFDGGKAPYRLWSVATDVEVLPEVA